MDGKIFIEAVEKELVPASPILGHAIRKQLADLGTTPSDLTPGDAMRFIEKMTEALELFMGRAEAQRNRKFMMSLLRKQAPEYFEEQSLI